MGFGYISSFRHFVRVSCEGHDFELLNLFAALEKERGQSGGKSVARSGGKMVRELKALKSSVNYDANVSSSRRSKKLGRTIDNVL